MKTQRSILVQTVARCLAGLVILFMVAAVTDGAGFGYAEVEAAEVPEVEGEEDETSTGLEIDSPPGDRGRERVGKWSIGVIADSEMIRGGELFSRYCRLLL